MNSKFIYLDQWCWSHLEEAARGVEQRRYLEPVLAAMAAAHEDGRAEFVLSTVHYIETAQRGYGPRRRQVAELMIEMSQHRTIRSALGQAEMDNAVDALLAGRTRAEPLDAFGYGAAHAFGATSYVALAPRATGHRLPNPQATPFNPTDQQLDPEGETLLLASSSPLLGIDANPYLNPVSPAFKRDQKREQHRLAQLNLSGTKLWKALADLSAIDTDNVDYLIAACQHRAVELDEVLTAATTLGSLGLLRLTPHQWVFTRMRYSAYRDREFTWRNSDHLDFLAFALVVPLCDVVVADKRNVELARQAGVGAEMDTVIINELRELPDHLA